ncbi:uncharacterized protein BP5553_00748 [Venustampulla echinocandica]|uniref:Uncharacterized protein n=1 Tax=Venustampulla echinocandica TaxID=2656787 RepID=A0A370TZ11_9HELO|nr:uncharacterized protein BP5553_00748 [Venustampulla echinocandica]RDL40769.1 hypothetical protein BP5553_00748 [Venustampulla echinocandica]
MASLKNIEQDEAGRLRAFRQRFGRGWDLDAPEDEAANSSSGDAKLESAGLHEDSLMDLISGAAGVQVDSGNAEPAKETEIKQATGKKGSK